MRAAGFTTSRGWPNPPVNLRPGGDGGDRGPGRSLIAGLGGVRGMNSTAGVASVLSAIVGGKLIGVLGPAGVRERG